jgi:hypothetical protein
VKYWLLLLVGVLLVAGCAPVPSAPTDVTLRLSADGQQQSVTLPAGSTVGDALEKAGLQLDTLDRVDPPAMTLAENDLSVTITRVEEVFEVEETVVPFERQTVRNESLPEGQTLLIQPGVNGLQRVTYRQVLENQAEVSRSIFNVVTVNEPRPEILMVGVQSPFQSVPVAGKIAYLTTGNAWLIEQSTGERRPIVTTGDLDGRIFELSPDGEWLLFTRSTEEGSDDINGLWVVNVTADEPTLVDLKIGNIIHHAAWFPLGGLTLTVSTVEPVSTAPGWQANNDLQLIKLAPNGRVAEQEEIIEANYGGVYGWWGTDFAWSPDGSALAYAQPDSIGVVDFENKLLVPRLEILPLQTRSDWAWLPPLEWSPDARVLYTVTHAATTGLTNQEESQAFHLSALLAQEGQSVELSLFSGMFAYPSISKPGPTGQYRLAFLEAIFGQQSETSRYNLIVMDRDGSNRSKIFPETGASGLEPQQVIWSPAEPGETGFDLAFIYQNNLWLIDSRTGQTQQVTGDGLISRIDWK